MGLRFRKSIKIAPGLKINLNKKSISATVGTKGAHYTVNSNGKRTASVGIPGTGIYYTKSSGDQKSQTTANNDAGSSYSYSQSGGLEPNNNRDNKKWYQKTGWIIAWLILFFPVGLFLMWKYADWKKPVKGIISALFAFIIIGAALSPKQSLESAKLSADTSKAYDIKQEVQIKSTLTPSDYTVPDTAYKTSGGKMKISDGKIYFSADKAGTYEIWLDYEGIKSNKVGIKIEDKKAIAKKKAEEEAKRKAEEEAKKKAEEEARKKAEEEADKKAEEERIAAEKAAAEQAEQERIAAEQAAAEESRIANEQQAQSTEETVYWVSEGEVYHSSQNCRTLKRSSNIQSGTISESGKSRPCKVCH